jgi:hypothetical protein
MAPGPIAFTGPVITTVLPPPTAVPTVAPWVHLHRIENATGVKFLVGYYDL